MPRRASLGTWLYLSCTALVFIFMSLRTSTGRRARPSRPPRTAPAPQQGDAVLATVPSHARLADSLTPPSPPASRLRPTSPPLPGNPPAARGKRHATPTPSSMVARFVSRSKPIAAGGAGEGAAAAAAAVGAATGKPAASSPPLPQSPRPLNPSKTPRTYSPVRSSPPTTYRAVSCATSRTARATTETPPPPRTGHTHGAALSSSQARAQHHTGSYVTPLATAGFSHCAPLAHHIPRGSAVPDLGPLLRVQNFEEQKHRLEHLRGGFYKLRPQFLTVRGHMQHASPFPARLKHRPPVSSHLNEKKPLPSHGWTSQTGRPWPFTPRG